MPRKADPVLQEKIVGAALRLLDSAGMHAISMRTVAREAKTTTPTIYQRFADRDALLAAVIAEIDRDLFDVLEPAVSVEEMFHEFLRFCCHHPQRLDLAADTFGTRLANGARMPGLDLLRSRLSVEVGVRGRKREGLALAIASLAFGTARAMIAAGAQGRHARELQRASIAALRLLLKAFADAKSASARLEPRSGN